MIFSRKMEIVFHVFPSFIIYLWISHVFVLKSISTQFVNSTVKIWNLRISVYLGKIWQFSQISLGFSHFLSCLCGKMHLWWEKAGKIYIVFVPSRLRKCMLQRALQDESLKYRWKHVHDSSEVQSQKRRCPVMFYVYKHSFHAVFTVVLCAILSKFKN